MHRTRGWAGLRITTFALALGAWFAPDAGAAALSSDSIKSYMEYSTLGTIKTEGIEGDAAISFKNVANGAFTAPSSFSLGEFEVKVPSTGVTTYTNTPFEIIYHADKVDGNVPSPNETPLVIKGYLNGQINGASQSSVVATFEPETIGPFLTGDYSSVLNILDTKISLVPSTTNGGRTTAQAQILAKPVPEPTSIAVFLTALTGLGLRRRLRARAAARS